MNFCDWENKFLSSIADSFNVPPNLLKRDCLEKDIENSTLRKTLLIRKPFIKDSSSEKWSHIDPCKK